jgi:hypothetical protein
MINRRLHPVMVNGSWDAVGLLFAASGALLFVGPAIIAILYHKSLDDVPTSGGSTPSFGDIWGPWWLIWLNYFVLVAAGGLALLWLRRNKTIVYNVAPGDFDRIVAQLMDRLGLDWNRVGNRIYVVADPGQLAEPVSAALQVANDPLVASRLAVATGTARPAGAAVVDVEPFGALCHVTLHWRRRSGLIREELEAELERCLTDLPAPDNPAASWLLGVAAFLLALIFLGVFIIVLNAFFPRH